VDDQRVMVRQCESIVWSVHAPESLTTANRGNDLDFIPIDEDRLRMLAPGDDLSVTLDGDALAFEGEVADEIGNPLRGDSANVGGAI